jgi:hypothetical protein
MIFYLRKIIRQQFLNNVVKIADKKCNSAISAERESAGALNICSKTLSACRYREFALTRLPSYDIPAKAICCSLSHKWLDNAQKGF